MMEKRGVVMDWKKTIAIIDMGIMSAEEAAEGMSVEVEVGMGIAIVMDMSPVAVAAGMFMPDIDMSIVGEW
jgi:hypothetical protein